MARFRCFFPILCGLCCVRLAGTVVCKADEPDSWPDSDYGQVFRGFLTSTQTAGIVNLYVRTCSRTTRVTALRMGGFKVARWREQICCVIPKRVAGVGFATFMEQTFSSRVPVFHCFLLLSPFRSRIRRKMLCFWLPRDGLGLCAGCAAAHMRRCACCACAHAAQHRTCAAPHMRTCAPCASAHSLRRIRIRA